MVNGQSQQNLSSGIFAYQAGRQNSAENTIKVYKLSNNINALLHLNCQCSNICHPVGILIKVFVYIPPCLDTGLPSY